MRTMYTLLLVAIAAAGLAGCGPKAVKPEPACARTPVVVDRTETRWVPIRADLTAQVIDPGPKRRTVGDAVKRDEGRGAALRQCNARLAGIAQVQGQAVAGPAPAPLPAPPERAANPLFLPWAGTTLPGRGSDR